MTKIAILVCNGHFQRSPELMHDFENTLRQSHYQIERINSITSRKDFLEIFSQLNATDDDEYLIYIQARGFCAGIFDALCNDFSENNRTNYVSFHDICCWLSGPNEPAIYIIGDLSDLGNLSLLIIHIKNILFFAGAHIGNFVNLRSQLNQDSFRTISLFNQQSTAVNFYTAIATYSSINIKFKVILMKYLYYFR